MSTTAPRRLPSAESLRFTVAQVGAAALVLGGVVAVVVDRERLTADLVASRAALRLSRVRILEAGDSERRRIAQDLHDGLQSRLVLLAMRAGGLVQSATDPVLARDAQELCAGLDAAITDLRRLVHGVMPAVLLERGLHAAVGDLADRMPIPVRLVVPEPVGSLPAAVETTAYRVVAEALTNALKHSGAADLEVCIERSAQRLWVEVRDDGVGGAVGALGSGLRGLADRVDGLGGRLSVTSPAERGTVVAAELPCGS
jgi:signal transduction histidine kinase